MRKCLLVVFIGMVMTIQLCGIVHEITTEKIEEIDCIAESTMSVYME